MRRPKPADSSLLERVFLSSAHGFAPQLHIEALYKHHIEAEVSDSQVEENL